MKQLSIFTFFLCLNLWACAQEKATRPAATPARALSINLKTKPAVTDKVTKTEAEWKKELTPEQYRVLREKGTERAFTHAYNKNKQQGLYLCAACSNPLFSSEAKFDSGTGWPASTSPWKEAAWKSTPTGSSACCAPK